MITLVAINNLPILPAVKPLDNQKSFAFLSHNPRYAQYFFNATLEGKTV